MKKLFVFPLLLMFLGFLGGCAESRGQVEGAEGSITETLVEGDAAFEWTSEEHVFGDIPQNIPVKHKFEFTNVGDGSLKIEKVKPTCGCTAADYSDKPVAPGEKGFITVEFNAKSPGNFNKSVTVFSNASDKPVILVLKGTVEPDPNLKSETTKEGVEITPLNEKAVDAMPEKE